MPSTTTSTLGAPTDPAVAERLAELQAEFDAITTERDADPLDQAADITAWQLREADRVARSVGVARRRQEIEQNGVLVADPAVAALVAQYGDEAAPARETLRPLATGRSQGAGGASNTNRAALVTWWRALTRLMARLPQEDPAALRLLARELNAFLQAREAYVAAIFESAQRGEVPGPAGSAGLPPRLRIGAYVVDQPA